MAGPQSTTPRQPLRRSAAKKVFTLAEANRALSLVKRIAADIVRTHGLVSGLQAKLTASTGSRTQRSTEDQLAVELGHLQDYADELSDVGCELKDCETGLVDFTGRHQGRQVCLCWKLGEEQIGYFHELHTGFAGRQPVSLLNEGP
jgi:hypothetical protein